MAKSALFFLLSVYGQGFEGCFPSKQVVLAEPDIHFHVAASFDLLTQ